MPDENRKISVRADGPYFVQGGLPLVHKSPVMSEHGEPLTWKKGKKWDTQESYRLCRCGLSRLKPFCDGTHEDEDFVCQDTADTGPIAVRETQHTGTGIVVKDDRTLCMHAGFCGNRVTNIWKMVGQTEDTQVRAQLMAMVEHCPSGALTYSLEEGGELVEPDLPEEVAVTPMAPYWSWVAFSSSWPTDAALRFATGLPFAGAEHPKRSHSATALTRMWGLRPTKA